MTSLALKLEERFTYFDYYNWTEGRWELIDGIVYDMSAAPSRIHQELSRELFGRLYNHLKDKDCKLYSAPFDVRLPDKKDADDEETFTVVQPDITVICDPSKLDDRGCKGPPDFIIEILSPSTVAKDMRIKRDLYEKHGVKEYWLVHPVDKIFMVYTLGQNNLYSKADVYTGEDVLISLVISDLKIQLTELFGPEPAALSPLTTVQK